MDMHRASLRFLAPALFALVLLLPTAPGSAAPPPGAVYAGTTSAGGTVRIEVTGPSVTVTVQHPGVVLGCPAATLSVQQVALAANGSQFTITAAPASDGVASMSGFFALPGHQAVAGAFSDRPASGCTPRVATWSATRLDPPVTPEPWPLAPTIQYQGVAYDIAGTPLGTAEAVTDAAGRVTVTVSAVQGNCAYRLSPATGAASRAAGPLLEVTGGAGRVVAVTSPSAVGGGFAAEAPSPACPALAGMWIARPPAAPAGSPPSGGGPARFAVPPAFGSGTTALAVFGGGTPAQLEAAARDAGATGVWAQDAAGRFALLVVDGPAFINAPFRTAFAAGLPLNTAVTLTR